MCLRKMHTCARELEPDSGRQMLERVCVPWDQLQLISYHLRLIHDTGMDPYTNGSKSRQEKHYEESVDCIVYHCLLEYHRWRAGACEVELPRLVCCYRGRQ